ncbi:MAG: zinc ribbon domain-containing protein [Candidatus Bathyarchaeia archaeon]
MAKSIVAEAFSAGLGLALGLTMAQYLFQALRPLGKPVKQVVICLKCGGKNLVENKFCGQCGCSLYPQPLTRCLKCGFHMPSNLNFCWICGSPLTKNIETR